MFRHMRLSVSIGALCPLKTQEHYKMFLFMYKSIHGLIEVDVSGIGYRVPYVRQRRHVLFRYLRQRVLAPLAGSIKVTNRVCDSGGVDCYNYDINTFSRML